MVLSKMMRTISILISLLCIVTTSCHRSPHQTLSLFPLDAYNQSVSTFIKAQDNDFDTPLLSPAVQKKHFENFYQHYLGAKSPWDIPYTTHIIDILAKDDLKALEKSILSRYNNDHQPSKQIGYGVNFHPYSADWNQRILANINLSQFDQLHFHADHRGIAITNLYARALPTDDPYFYHYKLAGQGYPFDNLQMSSIWAGTPVYILGETRDHAWYLVLTPDLIAWVKSNGIALADSHFINRWHKQAKRQLAAITKTAVSLVDIHHQFLLTAYIGTTLPAEPQKNAIKLWVPGMDSNHHAIINYAIAPHSDATLMPLLATPHHFSMIMNSLIGRPYGWGNMYFYNDCSAELKNIYSVFGIWLPRNSSEQIYTGVVNDLSADSKEQRLSYLMAHGHKLMTIVYVGGHIFMYIGNYPNPNSTNHELMAMTYQNVWGLSPKKSANRRAIIGKAVILPLLLQYPEDPELHSHVNKQYFKMSFLDEVPTTTFKIDPASLISP